MEVKTKWYVDLWQEIKDATMTTIGKNKGSYPDSNWKRRMLMSEHSTIRTGRIILKLFDIPTFVMGHLVRHHIGVEKYVGSKREDLFPSDEVVTRNTPVDMTMDNNFQSLINMSRKRLCNRASLETRQAWQLTKDEVALNEPELARCMVRECVYRNGLCPEPEGRSCGFNHTKEFKAELRDYLEGLESQICEDTNIFKERNKTSDSIPTIYIDELKQGDKIIFKVNDAKLKDLLEGEDYSIAYITEVDVLNKRAYINIPFGFKSYSETISISSIIVKEDIIKGIWVYLGDLEGKGLKVIM